MTKHWRFAGQALVNKDDVSYPTNAVYFNGVQNPTYKEGGSLLLLQLPALPTSKTHAVLLYIKVSSSPAGAAGDQGG